MHSAVVGRSHTAARWLPRHARLALLSGCLVLAALCLPTFANDRAQQGLTSCSVSNGCFFSRGQWSNRAGGSTGVAFTPSGIAMAAEVNGPPPFNDFPLCPKSVCSLTFYSVATGLPNSIEMLPMQFDGGSPPGSDFGMTWNDEEGEPLPNFQNAVSIGDLDDWEDDDVSFRFLDGPPVHAFGFELRDNSADTTEELRLYGVGNVLLRTYDMSGANSGSGIFVGFISDVPVERVEFDEGSGGDDIAIASLWVGAVQDKTRSVLRRPIKGHLGFGNTISVDDDWLAIQSVRDDQLIMYGKGGPQLWQEQLLISLGEVSNSAELEGDSLAIGFDAGSNGFLEVFRQSGNTWTPGQFFAGPPSGQGSIGHVTSFDDDLMLTAGNSSATLFQKIGGSWQEVATLTPSPATSMITKVVVDGDRAAIARVTDGAPGVVHLFQRDSGGPGAWGQTQVITSPDPSAGDEFGASLSLSDGLLAVGAPGYAEGVASSGRVFLFERLPGILFFQPVLSLFAPVPGAAEEFGRSVAIARSDIIYVGAPGSHSLEQSSGAVYQMNQLGHGRSGFESGGWLAQALPIHLAEESDRWGARIDLDRDGGTLLVAGDKRVFVMTLLFSDGFESGDTTAWSLTTP